MSSSLVSYGQEHTATAMRQFSGTYSVTTLRAPSDDILHGPEGPRILADVYLPELAGQPVRGSSQRLTRRRRKLVRQTRANGTHDQTRLPIRDLFQRRCLAPRGTGTGLHATPQALMSREQPEKLQGTSQTPSIDECWQRDNSRRARRIGRCDQREFPSVANALPAAYHRTN